MENPEQTRSDVSKTATPEHIRADQKPMGISIIGFLVAYLMILGFFLVYGLIILFPHPTPAGRPVPAIAPSTSSSQPPANPAPTTPVTEFDYLTNPDPQSIRFLGISFQLYNETRLVLLVMFCGAIGAYLRSTISLATTAERGRLPHPPWILWCIFQTYIGMLLATIFFFILRGTTLSPMSGFENMNVHSTLGIAALVGLFSPQATDKLRSFFSSVSVGSERAQHKQDRTRAKNEEDV